MKKRLLSMILAIVMLIGISASAASIFTLPSASEMENVISYGVQMGVEPISETTLADGSLKQLYNNATDQSFTDFGIILGEQGYSLADQKVVNGVIVATVVKEDISFTVEYDRNGGMLAVIYPKGTKIEVPEIPDPFEGYIPLKFNEVVRLTDKGDIKIESFMSTDGVKGYMYGNNFEEFGGALRDFDYELKFTFTNISKYSIEAHTLFSNMKLHYINDDNHYTYNVFYATVWGEKFEIGRDGKDGIIYYYKDYNQQYSLPEVSSMEKGYFSAGFSDIPSLVRTSKDGIMAITFNLYGIETPYVLYIRK